MYVMGQQLAVRRSGANTSASRRVNSHHSACPEFENLFNWAFGLVTLHNGSAVDADARVLRHARKRTSGREKKGIDPVMNLKPSGSDKDNIRSETIIWRGLWFL